MALTLDDIMKLPDEPTIDHLTALGIVRPQPQPPAMIPAATVASAMSPADVKEHALAREFQPAKDLGRELRRDNRFLNAENKPFAPAAAGANPIASPEMETAAAAAPGALGIIAGAPELPNLSSKEPQALPTMSTAARPGTSEFYQNELQRIEHEKAHPWGTAENHPGVLGKIAHGLATAGNIAGNILAPAAMASIPGTELNRRVREMQAAENFAQARERESAEKTKELQRQNLESEIAERTGKNTQELVQDAQGNVTGWKDKKGLHSLEDPDTPESIKKIAESTTGKNVPEADQPIGVDVAALNKQLENRYQVLHPGKSLPDEYKVPENAKKGDYVRIDKALSQTENAEATKAQRDTLNEMRRQTNILAKQKHDASEDAIEAAAKTLASGDLTRLKDIASMRGDQRLLIFNRAKELNPKFTPSVVDRMIKMYDEYTTGKIGDQLQSFGTFLEHAGAAKDAADNIYNSSVPLFNKPLNWWKEHASGDPNYQAFVTALEPVRKEFEGFLLGGRALYGDDRKNAEIILNENSSPAQINAALKQMGHTVKARYNELDHRFQNTMHHSIEQTVGPLSDAAKEGADKIGVKIGAEATKPVEAPAGKTAVYDPEGNQHFVFSNKVKDFLNDPKYKGWSENAPKSE